jgi:SOS-response transcriptional repressor LexA
MTNKLPLTEKETDIIAFIYGYIDENKYSPTRKEIADKFKMSTQASNYFIKQLAEKGKIKILANKWRNIKIV